MGGGARVPGQYLGTWGDIGSPVQKGITAYAMSSNKQRPLAGALNAAMSNTFRRSSKQFLYVVPPFVVAYMAMTWAIERNDHLNSKSGRAEYAENA